VEQSTSGLLCSGWDFCILSGFSSRFFSWYESYVV